VTSTIWRALGLITAGGVTAFGAVLAHDFKTGFIRFVDRTAKRADRTEAER